MNLPEEVLGRHLTNQMRTRNALPILRIGSDHFTRHDLSTVDCFNFMAAQRLSEILNEHLRVPNLRHVFEKVPPSALALPGLGGVSLAVLGAAFEAKGLGGDAPLLNYVTRHNEETKQAMVTFHSLKHRMAKDEAGERKATKQRKAARRNQAHALRSTRFATRQTA